MKRQSGTIDARYMKVYFTGGITDMGVTINIDNLKKRCFLLLVIVFYCGLAWLAYYVSIQALTDLIESRSIFIYFWGLSLSFILYHPGSLLFCICIYFCILYKKPSGT